VIKTEEALRETLEFIFLQKGRCCCYHERKQREHEEEPTENNRERRRREVRLKWGLPLFYTDLDD
jgi:hypothetical protein